MKFELPTKLSGYLPEAISILSSIEDINIFNEDKNLSHPADLFLLAFNDVMECAFRLSKRLNEEVDQTRISTTAPADLNDIRFDIFNLFFYTSNFIEACQSIIKSMFKEGGKDKNFIKAIREFNDNTKSYRDHTSKIINLIKHQHRRISPFSYSWSNNLIIGYFVEGLVAPTVIGPDPQVHQKYNGQNTGISLNFDIPFHIANIYFSSACLSSVIKKYTEATQPKTSNLLKDETLKCLKEVSKIDLIFFPNEISNEIPSITERKAENFLIEMPSRKKPKNNNLHVANISVIARIGIKNRTIAPPYLFVTGNG
jgi:hypothetical protein